MRAGLTTAVKRQALHEGFDLVGVATAGPTTSAARLQAWLAAGMHGDMGYLERSASLRSEPARLLEGCRSVVVVAMSYRTDIPPSEDWVGRARVWISRYAWGRDYHKVLIEPSANKSNIASSRQYAARLARLDADQLE